MKAFLLSPLLLFHSTRRDLKARENVHSENGLYLWSSFLAPRARALQMFMSLCSTHT